MIIQTGMRTDIPAFYSEWHISEFEHMAKKLAGYTKTCVISFIDIYKKVERNFPQAKAVSLDD